MKSLYESLFSLWLNGQTKWVKNVTVVRTQTSGATRGGYQSRKGSAWYSTQLQPFIVSKAEQVGIRVEDVAPLKTSRRGAEGTRDGDYSACPECGRGRHAELNDAETIRRREGDLCTV
jgi:transposase